MAGESKFERLCKNMLIHNQFLISQERGQKNINCLVVKIREIPRSSTNNRGCTCELIFQESSRPNCQLVLSISSWKALKEKFLEIYDEIYEPLLEFGENGAVSEIDLGQNIYLGINSSYANKIYVNLRWYMPSDDGDEKGVRSRYGVSMDENGIKRLKDVAKDIDVRLLRCYRGSRGAEVLTNSMNSALKNVTHYLLEHQEQIMKRRNLLPIRTDDDYCQKIILCLDFMNKCVSLDEINNSAIDDVIVTSDAYEMLITHYTDFVSQYMMHVADGKMQLLMSVNEGNDEGILESVLMDPSVTKDSGGTMMQMKRGLEEEDDVAVVKRVVKRKNPNPSKLQQQHKNVNVL